MNRLSRLLLAGTVLPGLLIQPGLAAPLAPGGTDPLQLAQAAGGEGTPEDVLKRQRRQQQPGKAPAAPPPAAAGQQPGQAAPGQVHRQPGAAAPPAQPKPPAPAGAAPGQPSAAPAPHAQPPAAPRTPPAPAAPHAPAPAAGSPLPAPNQSTKPSPAPAPKPAARAPATELVPPGTKPQNAHPPAGQKLPPGPTPTAPGTAPAVPAAPSAAPPASTPPAGSKPPALPTGRAAPLPSQSAPVAPAPAPAPATSPAPAQGLQRPAAPTQPGATAPAGAPQQLPPQQVAPRLQTQPVAPAQGARPASPATGQAPAPAPAPLPTPQAPAPAPAAPARNSGINPGAAAALGAAAGFVGGFMASQGAQRLQDVQQQRQEYDEGGVRIIREPGRTFVRENDQVFLRHDETERFRELGGDLRSEQRGDEQVTIYRRPDGSEVITVTDDTGRLLRRARRYPDGREEVIIDNTWDRRPRRLEEDVVELPPAQIRIPRERYIVDADTADEQVIYETLTAPPIAPLPKRYTLDEVRFSPDLRARMRSVDVNTINFETGSWTITPDQAARLGVIAQAIRRAIDANPREVFLVEGHTDAVGSDIDNLSLSDRRAQAAAATLTRDFGVPPENLTTQGYGKQYLKVQTEGASRENRRVTVRRITPLIDGTAAGDQPQPQ